METDGPQPSIDPDGNEMGSADAPVTERAADQSVDSSEGDGNKEEEGSDEEEAGAVWKIGGSKK